MGSRGTCGRYSRWVGLAALLLAVVVNLPEAWAADGPPAAPKGADGEGVAVWDTGAPLPDGQTPRRTSRWRRLPEREGSRPAGDVVVESRALVVAFHSRSGSVTLFSPGEPSKPRGALIPLELKGKAMMGASLQRSAKRGEAPSITASFATKALGRSASATFSLTAEGILTLRPGPGMTGVSVSGPISAAIVPSILGDDLIYDASNYPPGDTLCLPAENWLMSLLEGEDAALVMTWPDGRQSLRGTLAGAEGAERTLRSVELATDGKPVSLALVAARGVWHRETLAPSYLERDVTSTWQRPFPATWLTQLDEDEVITTFGFREAKQEMWRGAFGSFTYPVWIRGDRATFSLGKKIPPEGEAVVYFVERNNGTPAAVLAPADIVRRTLDDATASRVLDANRRQVSSPGRANYVVGAAACATTDKLRPILEAGQEAEKQGYIREGTEDMIHQSTTLRARADAYQEFGRQMIDYLGKAGRERPELRPYLEGLEQTTRELFAAFDERREPMHDLPYARDLARQTIELARERRPGNPAAFMKLQEQWRGMGGTLEGLNRKLNSIARKLMQQAGYGCAGRPSALPIAAEVRARSRAMLANPDHYESFGVY